MVEKEIRWGALEMSLMNLMAIQTFVTCDRIEVEKRAMYDLYNLPENAIGILVQEYQWDCYRDVFGAIIKSYDFLPGCNAESPMKKAYKYQHPVYGKLRFISPRIKLNLVRSCFKSPRNLEVWSV